MMQDRPIRLSTEYVGKRWPLFWLAFKTSVLTVLTLGLYRFWAKTRMRRYYWSAIRPGAAPLEYVGDPWEKLLGFLIAVTFLAFYIGLVNLVLMFVSFSLLGGNGGAYLLSFVGLVPFYFYARYRARRYILARTRWLGLRFGMEKGAWHYSWRGVLHTLSAFLTLGLLWPRTTFLLEKFRTDRTYFGTAQFHQGGKWTMLYRGMIHLIPAILTLVGLIAYVVFQAINLTQPEAEDTIARALRYLPLLALWIIFGLAHYRAVTFCKLTEHKTIGAVQFRAYPSRWRLFWIYLLGNLATYLLVLLPALALIGLFVASPELFMDGQIAQPTALAITLFILTYFISFTLWGAAAHAFVTMPVARHLASSVHIRNAEALKAITQRPRDEMTHAEGFAEALDVGAAL